MALYKCMHYYYIIYVLIILAEFILLPKQGQLEESPLIVSNMNLENSLSLLSRMSFVPELQGEAQNVVM